MDIFNWLLLLPILFYGLRKQDSLRPHTLLMVDHRVSMFLCFIFKLNGNYYAYMYICMYMHDIHMCILRYACHALTYMYACHALTYMYACLHTYIHTYIRMYIHNRTDIFVCVRICLYVCTYFCIMTHARPGIEHSCMYNICQSGNCCS